MCIRDRVSVDYLLGLTNNRRYENTPIEELHLSDEVVELLKSERDVYKRQL